MQYTCMFPGQYHYARVKFWSSDLGGVEENVSYLPTSKNEPTAFVEPLFAPSSSGPDLFALRDGESIRKIDGWRVMETKRGSSFV